MSASPDFIISDHGSAAMLTPRTDEARDWINATLEPEPWQWLGGGVAIEPRYLPQIVEGLIEEGYTVR